MNILITGGNGFIAKSLQECLKEYNITAVTRDDFDLLNTEATNLFFKTSRNSLYFLMFPHQISLV